MNRLSLLVLSGVVLVGAAGCRNQDAAAAPAAPPPPAVSFVTVSPEEVPVTGEWIATLDGNVNAQIRPQVSGYLIRRAYQEGAYVKKGQVLFEIDRRPFEAARSQAQAQYAEAEAALAKTERDLKRDRPLAEQRAIAQSQLDNDQSANDAAKAALSSSKAALDTAELNLGFTRVTSLIDGIAAIASAQIGDLVGPTTLLTTVSQLDPIKAYFPLSEQEYLGIAGSVATPESTGKLWQASGGLSLVLADETVYPRKGRVLAVDRQVDPKMGTIRISAVFPNPGNVLRPGSIRPRPRPDYGAQAGAAGAAARGRRAPDRLPAAHRHRRQQGVRAQRQARTAHRQSLDRRRRPEVG